jgi:hypothetical protein
MVGETVAGLDYVYALDRPAALAGAGLTINGNVRLNGGLTLGADLLLNGTAYAAGQVSGVPKRLGHATYIAQSSVRARPGDPAGRFADAGRWPMGYTDASPVSVPRLPALVLPRAPSLAACMQ